MIQQAIAQQLTPIFELKFSDNSYGFRPHRNAHQAIKKARQYLNLRGMINGVIVEIDKGCPQGGPLSPLLSNIMLDVLDKELEERNHKFCRYADDNQ